MNTPNPTLMQQYGTRAVFLEKAAGAAPLLERLGAGLFNLELFHGGNEEEAKQRAQAEQVNEAARELELARMDQATGPLRYTQVPFFGGNEGLTRLASAAAQVGTRLAKQAAFVPPPDLFSKAKRSLTGGMGLKTNLMLGAGALTTGYLANKGIHKATGYLGSEPQTPVYGPGRFGRQLPYGVNAYGQPQVGTPLI